MVAASVCNKRGGNTYSRLEEQTMTPEIAVVLAGTLISVFFEYAPKVEGWYAQLEKQVKASIMAAAVSVVILGAMLISCYGPYDYFACEVAGFWDAAELFVLALVANQTTHRLTRKSRTQ